MFYSEYYKFSKISKICIKQDGNKLSLMGLRLGKRFAVFAIYTRSFCIFSHPIEIVTIVSFCNGYSFGAVSSCYTIRNSWLELIYLFSFLWKIVYVIKYFFGFFSIFEIMFNGVCVDFRLLKLFYVVKML